MWCLSCLQQNCKFVAIKIALWNKVWEALKSRKLCADCQSKIREKSWQIFKLSYYLWGCNFFLLRPQFSYSFMLEMMCTKPCQRRNRNVVSRLQCLLGIHGYTHNSSWKLPSWLYHIQPPESFRLCFPSTQQYSHGKYGLYCRSGELYSLLLYDALSPFLQHKNSLPIAGPSWCQESSFCKSCGFRPRKSSSKCCS